MHTVRFDCAPHFYSLYSAGKPLIMLHTLVGAALVIGPLGAFQLFGYAQFCRGASPAPPWCAASLPYLYGYVQSHYWGVGFLRYFQLQQVRVTCTSTPSGTDTGCSQFYTFHCYSHFKRKYRCISGINLSLAVHAQVPNFLLAMPVLVLTWTGCVRFVRDHGLLTALRAVFLPGKCQHPLGNHNLPVRLETWQLTCRCPGDASWEVL